MGRTLCPVTVERRRRKHWGWGFEDEQPARRSPRAAAGIAAHLGLRRPGARGAGAAGRRRAAAAAAGDAVRERHVVARRARGRALVPRRRARDARRVPAPARRRRDPGLGGGAARGPRLVRRARRGGRAVRRRDERGRRRSTAGSARGTRASWRSTCARLDRVLEVDPRLARGADPGRRDRPAARGAARRARADAALLPAVVRALDARRLDRHARGRALRERADAHRRPRRVRARADGRRRRVGVAAAAGLRRRARRPTGCCSAPRARSRSSPRRGCGCCERPEQREARRAVRFDSFAAGAEAVREILQAGLRPANCRLVEAEEARLTLAGDGSAHAARARLRGGRRVPPTAPSRSASPRRRVAEPRGGSGAWREAFLRAPYLRDTLVAMGVLSETFETAITWERLPAFVETVKGTVREALGPEGSRHLPPHARLSGRRGALLHRARAGRARRARPSAGRRDQGGRRGRRARRRRHDHPPPRGRPRPPPLVRRASGPSRSPPRCGPPRRRSIRAGCSTPGYSSTRDEQRQRQEHGSGLQGQGDP